MFRAIVRMARDQFQNHRDPDQQQRVAAGQDHFDVDAMNHSPPNFWFSWISVNKMPSGVFARRLLFQVPHAEPAEVKHRQRSAQNEHRVTRQPHPFQQRERVAGNELQRAGVEITHAHRMIELDAAERKQRGKHHPGQPEVQRPEADFRRAVAPQFFGNHVTQAEQRQADRQHSINAHHRRVGVIGRERGADFIIGNNRQVDEKTENSRAEKIPEADGRQKHHRPEMRKRRARLRTLLRAELEEAPRLDREERQRNHFRRREERAERHVQGGFAGEIQMVHRADDAARRIQHHVQINQPHGHALIHHAEQHENVGDHDRREQFEKILHPQMDDPEPPEIRGGESGVRSGRAGRRRKTREWTSAEKKNSHGMLPMYSVRNSLPQSTEQDHDPEEQAHRQQDLPESAEIQKLKP